MINYKYLFFFIVLFYCAILSQFGLENFDTGYIPSFSWRVINGSSIYRDFIYKGPPATIYFCALWMKILPETAQFIQIRIVVYLLFALQVYFAVSGFYAIYDFSKVKINKWALMSVCFIISLLNFSPYPWPTTDGLLFASFAFYLVCKRRNINFFALFMVAIFSVLSALTKQSFYPVPFIFLAWIYIRYDLKKASLFLIQLVFLAGVFISLILSVTTLGNFTKLTTGETHFYDLFYVGLHNYIFIPLYLFLALIGITAMFLFFSKGKAIVLMPYIKWLSISLFSIAVLLCISKQIPLASRVAFDATLIAIAYSALYSKKSLVYLAPILVSLCVAWCSSISLGYQYPILFSTGIILSFIVLMKDDFIFASKYYLPIALPVCIIAFSYNIKPYRESNIFDLSYSLESVSPKLKFIKTNKNSFEKYLELKKLINKYGEHFIVAPNIPMANYLFNNKSELPADWLIQTEVNRQYDAFIAMAADKKNFIFLEKSFVDHEEFMPEKIEDFSYISWFIANKFQPIEETKYFIIYNSLKENEKLL